MAASVAGAFMRDFVCPPTSAPLSQVSRSKIDLRALIRLAIQSWNISCPIANLDSGETIWIVVRDQIETTIARIAMRGGEKNKRVTRMYLRNKFLKDTIEVSGRRVESIAYVMRILRRGHPLRRAGHGGAERSCIAPCELKRTEDVAPDKCRCQ